MKKILMTLGVFLATTPLVFAQAPVGDAVDAEMVFADIQPLQTVDPMITGSTPERAQPAASHSGVPALQLCDTACQMQRLDRWRTIAVD